ncbi:hypothetical protein [Actinomadura bangladeshensis]|uniref:Uncharacterized protein n=1 Tax=Actinomadura bangladeshensis TaxID=453573 RepID=A0A4R4NFJ1_9ACTN|nr:hypothetical protein [Actinomadura bangladeshensis]TDC07961.1 hypothetical protein E1284_31625 [Actinomadura bangladeshensis]
MSDHTEAGRLDQRTAEQLLGGAGGHAPLHSLLAAAAAPGRPEELAGEDAAVAAFLAAPVPARASRLAVLRRFMTAKVIALIGGTILLTGGVAYATGHFPGQDPAPAPSPGHHRQGGDGHDNTPATQYSPTPLHTSPTPSPSSSASSAEEQQRHGKATAPGQQKNSPNPHSTSAPPRGPGSGNGTPPTAKPGKGQQTHGTGGTAKQGSPTGEKSGRGAENGATRQPAPAPAP